MGSAKKKGNNPQAWRVYLNGKLCGRVHMLMGFDATRVREQLIVEGWNADITVTKETLT